MIASPLTAIFEPSGRLLAAEFGSIGPDPRVFLIVGVLGGFTTFSGFSLENVRLTEFHQFIRTGLYVAVSIAFAFTAAAPGIATGRARNR